MSRKASMSGAPKPLDDAIAERLVTAITPMTIELALEALTSMEERDKAIAAQWRRRSEQAVGIVGGEPKCCKSFLALGIAVAVAAGLGRRGATEHHPRLRAT